jgi:hypothetical protein
MISWRNECVYAVDNLVDKLGRRVRWNVYCWIKRVWISGLEVGFWCGVGEERMR